LRLAGMPDLSAAVVDFGLSDGDGAALCQLLKERRIPFVLHSAYDHVHEACRDGVVVPKPADPAVLVSTIAGFLQ
jgi:CheY-like chemotaxis protein